MILAWLVWRESIPPVAGGHFRAVNKRVHWVCVAGGTNIHAAGVGTDGGWHSGKG
ncbi:hypothetical protein [Ramlibacter sp.]|uniref:hypothetical protein n=1 Tax=Ramlibacter sp. TaxID=1917967 RepID=UPI0026272A72|nr:hypothetical protein [Ramlibacter sp.]